MDLNAVMDALGVRLKTIAGLRVYDYPPDSIAEPAAVVNVPTITYDVVGGGGADLASFPIAVLLGRVSDRAARDSIAEYVDREGAKSIKAALEADMTLAGTAKGLRVHGAEPAAMTVGQVEYLAYILTVEVYAT
jgi:hypothetical protein